MEKKLEWKPSTADQAKYNESKISCMNALFAYAMSKEKLEKRKKKLFTKGWYGGSNSGKKPDKIAKKV